MAYQTINVGAAPNDGTGDPVRTAFQKVNSNFTQPVPAAQLPLPTLSTVGAVQALTAASHFFLTGIGTDGVPTAAQPAFTDLSGTLNASQLPLPTASTLGGIQSYSAISHQWINSISTSGVPSSSQPIFSDIAGSLALSQMAPAVLGITRSQIALYDLTSYNRFLTSDGAPWIKGTSSADPNAIQDLTGQWWKLDLSNGIINALWFGVSTSNTASANATALQAALNTGLDVYVPGGAYSVTSISYTGVGQALFGDGCGAGGGTVLTMTPGTGDGVAIGNTSSYTTGLQLYNIQLNLSAATGGNAINCKKVKYLVMSNVIVVQPFCGILITSGNTISLTDVRVTSVQTGATNYALKAVGTDADPINVLNIYRFTCSPVNTGVANRAQGIIVDGAVDTTDIVGCGCTRMGRGLWVVNTGGTTNTPSFINSHSFQADFPENEGVRIESGGDFSFQNYYVHGSSNTDGVYIASGVFDVEFGTGSCTGNAQNGFNLNGTGAVIAGSQIARNSASASNTYDGVAFGASAVGGSVTGNQIGEYNGTTGLQRYGVSINASATNISLGPNNYNGNVTGPFLGVGTPTATMSRYACATAGSEYVVDHSAVQSSHTGDTSETTLATIPIPANAMGANGYALIQCVWTMTNSANNKTTRVKFGGTIMGSAVFTTEATFTQMVMVSNRNATNSQMANPITVGSGGWGQTTSAINTSAIDTTSAVSVTLTGQLANSGETIAIESYVVKVFYKP